MDLNLTYCLKQFFLNSLPQTQDFFKNINSPYRLPFSSSHNIWANMVIET